MTIPVSKTQPYSRTALRALSLMGFAFLSGCAEVPSTSGPNWGQPPREQVKLTAAEECAIGYDLAEQVYRQVKVTDTVIKVSPRLGACGEHAVKYLRKAGYGVDETAKKAEPHHFSIETYEDKDTGGVFATPICRDCGCRVPTDAGEAVFIRCLRSILFVKRHFKDEARTN